MIIKYGMFKKLTLLLIFIAGMFSFSSAAEEDVVKKAIDKLATQIKNSFKTPVDKEHKKRIAIISFENTSEQSKKQNIGRGVSELLTNNFVGSGLFTVIEREQLEKVLKEQALGLSGIIDPASAKEVGKILGVEAMLCGTISEFGDFYSITARIIDVETAQILTSAVTDIKRDLLTKEITKYMIVIEKKSPMTAALYSAIVPGMGQFYNGQKTKGVIIGGLELVAIGGTVFFWLEGNKAYSEYEDSTRVSDLDRLYKNSQESYDKMEKCEIGVGAIWLISVVDAYWSCSKAPEKTIKAEKKESSIQIKFEQYACGYRPMLVYSRGF